MTYHMLSPERLYTKPAQFANKDGYRQARLEHRHREEVMTFSAAFEPEWLDEREGQEPVYLPRRRDTRRVATELQPVQPVSNFDTGRTPVLSRVGLRRSVAAVLAMILLACVGAFTLSYHLRISAVTKQHDANLDGVRTLEKRAAVMQAEISAMMSEGQVASAAMALGMQRVRSHEVIYLTVPDDVVCSLPTDVTLGGSHYATMIAGN